MVKSNSDSSRTKVLILQFENYHSHANQLDTVSVLLAHIVIETLGKYALILQVNQE